MLLKMDNIFKLGLLLLLVTFTCIGYSTSQEDKDYIGCWILKAYKGRSSGEGFVIRNETFTEAECKEWCTGTDLCAAAEYNTVNNTCSVHAFSQVQNLTSSECCNYYDKIENPECSELHVDKPTKELIPNDDEKTTQTSTVAANMRESQNSQNALTIDTFQKLFTKREHTDTQDQTVVNNEGNVVTVKKDMCMKLITGEPPTGGEEISNMRNEAQCLARCLENPSCLAVDWRQTCFIHQQIQNVTNSKPANSGKHYRKVKCADEDRGTTARTTIDSLNNIDRECKREVDTMMEMPLYSQYGGARLTHEKFTQEQCTKQCLNISECVSVDYNIWERSCWILTKRNRNAPLPNNCCNHFIKVKTCLYDCFTIYMSKTVVSKPLQIFTVAMSEEACQRKCLDISNCQGFQYNESTARCSLFDNTTIGEGEQKCCDVWVKRTCKGFPNDTFIYPTTTSTTTPTTTATTDHPETESLPTIPAFMLPGMTGDDAPLVPLVRKTDEAKSDKSSGLLSPVSLVVLVGCVFVFIVGVVTLVGFIIHRKREQKLLESESYNTSSPSMWLSDFTGGLSRAGGGSYWTGESPLDLTSSSSTDLRRHDNHNHHHGGVGGYSSAFDFRRLKDQRRRSFHATSVPRDYSETLETYPLHNVRSLPYIDNLGLTNYPSFTCPGYKGLGGRGLPRYGAAGGSGEYPGESHVPEGYPRTGGFYSGNSAYP